MKLITAQLTVTHETLNLTTVDAEDMIKNELRTRLRTNLEVEMEREFSDTEWWSVVARYFIEFRSVYRKDALSWTVIATTAIPEDYDLFTEGSNV